eukprot:1767627-Amphidinium_carterae.1
MTAGESVALQARAHNQAWQLLLQRACHAFLTKGPTVDRNGRMRVYEVVNASQDPNGHGAQL